jgi:hypothetical protein
MSLSIAEQFRNLGLTSIAKQFEPPAACLKRLEKKRLAGTKTESDIRGPLPWDRPIVELRREAERRYLKFVRRPHSSPQWQESRLTARGI